MQAVGREQLNALAALRPPFPPRSFVPRRNAYREFDLEGWIRERGVPVKREGPWQRDGYRWILEECPWNRHADNAAYIVRFANGAIAAGCHHNSCQGYGWRELREHYEPGTYERQDLIGGAEDADASGEGEGKKPTQAELLTRYADEAELFHTLDGEAYATISVSGHQETHLIKSKGFRHFLVRQFYDEHGKPPGSQALQDALGLLEAKAQFDGAEHAVYVRIADHEGIIYVDLANDRWEAVEISAGGWRIVNNPPVKFRRSKGMLALPTPKRSGKAEQLRRFINTRRNDEASWRLLLAWLVAALRPTGPYPVLILQGEQGSAKSTVERILRSLLDPSTAPLRTTPRNERDLIIAATNSWVVAFDNISTLQPWLSDALCRLSTGGGLSTRELYTNAEEALFDATRPVILNGISDVATRPDLLDRALIVALPPISGEQRRPEAKLWREFEAERPSILGSLFDAVSEALGKVVDVRLEGMPRMADFAVWATAAEGSFGWDEGAFIDAYSGNRGEATEQALDADPVAEAVRQFMQERDEWSGTASELWKALGELVDEDVRRSKAWPGAPNALSNCMKRIAPALREIGIHYSDNIEGHQRTRTKYLRKVEDQRKMSSASSASLAPNEKDPQISKKERGLFADDGQRCGRPADDPVRRDRSQETPAKVPVREDADSADDDLRPHSTADASEVVSAIRQLLDMHPEARQQSPEQIASDLYIWTDLGYELEPSEVEEALKQVLP
jgi:hypothetical protein